MTTARTNAPVIIKRKKIVGGDGHHGGAWKVAYADFVTAMMAFFLLMWLLSATSDEQRQGLAEYFNPTISLSNSATGGTGMFGGDSIYTQDESTKTGVGAAQRASMEEDRALGQSGLDAERAGEGEGDPEDSHLEDLAEKLSARSGESMVSEDLARHIVTRVTDLGLTVELYDLPDAVLFAPESDDPTTLMRRLVYLVSGVFALSENEIAIRGFVRSEPVVRLDKPIWDVSMARAQAVRGLVEGNEKNSGRIQRVTGFADRQAAVPNPMSVRNNRIELVLLR